MCEIVAYACVFIWRVQIVSQTWLVHSSDAFVRPGGCFAEKRMRRCFNTRPTLSCLFWGLAKQLTHRSRIIGFLPFCPFGVVVSILLPFIRFRCELNVNVVTSASSSSQPYRCGKRRRHKAGPFVYNIYVIYVTWVVTCTEVTETHIISKSKTKYHMSYYNTVQMCGLFGR